MMVREQRPQVGLRQRQKLSQTARQLLQLVVAPPVELAALLDRVAGENPFVALSRSFPRLPGGAVDGASSSPGLYAHVLAELPLLLRRASELPIALRLVEGLDERGFLADSPAGIAAELHLPPALVEEVLARLQRIEPAGLFARSVSECLALQLRAMGELDDAAVRLLCNLEALARLGAAEFARRHQLDPGRVAELMALIARLSRDPAAAFGATALGALPELQFDRQGETWTVRPILPAAPHLKLRPAAFARALAAARTAEARRDLRRMWHEARALLQAVALRDATLERLGQALLLHQRQGLDSRMTRLAPLTRSAMAAHLSVHPSTVSRMVRDRFALVEGRILPLSRFFERPRAAGDAAPVTRSVVLAALRELIASDPDAAAMSDAALARKLAASGLAVTRRRLCKYRALMGLPSSRLRRGARGAA